MFNRAEKFLRRLEVLGQGYRKRKGGGGLGDAFVAFFAQ
jgi:hypothetical protein